MHDVLASLLFRVETVESGEEAVNMVGSAEASDPFGIVLMDWKMPGMDGIEATRRILAPRGPRQAPVVIVLSASGGGEEERVAALAAGAADFLLKPVTASTIVDALLRVFAPGLIPEASRAARNGARHRVQGVRILLVEDNEVNQQIAVELLRGDGASVTLAANGREAVDTLAAHPDGYDVILMDIQMPEMDGYEATKRIRAAPWGSEIPIIAMTAHALLEERQKALEMGMNDHISKPIDPDAMFETLALYCTPREPVTEERPNGTPNDERPNAARPDTARTDGGPAPRGEAALPEIAGSDLEAGLRRVSGNRTLFADLMVMFADGQEEAPARIQDALKAKDVKLAERLAHTVKGSAGNLGITGAEKAASALEQGIRKGAQAREVEKMRRRLAEVLEDVIAHIRSAFPRGESGGRGEPGGTEGRQRGHAGEEPAREVSVDAAELEEIVARLQALVRDHDSAAVDVFEEALPTLSAAFAREDLDAARKSLRMYDFAAAAAKLGSLRELKETG